jgi:hypothetical protein
MTKIQTTILVSLLLLVCGAFVSGATLSVTDLALASSDASGTIDVMLDQAPTGLAGYQLEISATPQGSAEFTAVNFPAAFSMNSASTLPASSVSIVAVDLMDQIKAGASAIKLATLTVHGLANGAADLQIAVTELTDDSGNPISPTIQPGKLTIGAAAPTPTPTQTPVAPLPTEVPTSVPTPTQTPPTPSPTEAPSAEPTTTPTMEPVPQPTGEPEPLVAAFTALPMTGTPPLTVNFTDHSTAARRNGDGTLVMERCQPPKTQPMSMAVSVGTPSRLKQSVVIIHRLNENLNSSESLAIIPQARQDMSWSPHSRQVLGCTWVISIWGLPRQP